MKVAEGFALRLAALCASLSRAKRPCAAVSAKTTRWLTLDVSSGETAVDFRDARLT